MSATCRLIPLLAVVTSFLAAFPSHSNAGLLYTVRGKDNRLFSIDTDTLALTEVGGHLGTTFTFGGLAYVPSTDTLLMIDGRAGGTLPRLALYSVDSTTGDASLIGPHRLTELFGLAFDSKNEVLYAVQGPSAGTEGLYELDVSDGSASFVGTTGAPVLYGGLAYDSLRDRLVALSGGVGDLYTINRTSGGATLLLDGPALGTAGLAYDSETDLFWGIESGGILRTYDPRDGFAATVRAELPRYCSPSGETCLWDGLAFVPTTVIPEPSSFVAFVSLGLAALGFGWYRRRYVKARG